MFKILLVTAIFLISGCDSSERNITDLAISSVLKQLKDPDSAKFSKVSLTKLTDDGAFSVCGSVNAKNAFGAYAGDIRFVVSGYKNNKNNEFTVYSSKLDETGPSAGTGHPETIFERIYWNSDCPNKHG